MQLMTRSEFHYLIELCLNSQFTDRKDAGEFGSVEKIARTIGQSESIEKFIRRLIKEHPNVVEVELARQNGNKLFNRYRFKVQVLADIIRDTVEVQDTIKFIDSKVTPHYDLNKEWWFKNGD